VGDRHPRRLALTVIIIKVLAPVVVALLTLAAGTTGCSTSAVRSGGVDPPPEPATACISTVRAGPEVPMLSPPTATTFSANPVPMRSFMHTGGDTITGRQAILDFSIPGQPVDPTRVEVLTEFTVTRTDPSGWRRSRSFDAVAFRTTDETRSSEQACPDQTPAVVAAMRAAGHEPLPERIEPGQSATGWVAFDIPRGATAVNLWLRHLDPDGGFAGAEVALLHIPYS